ncbi:MAG TPA: hypothetical protein VKA30_01015, partial [Actinomycetota bacterium]|nr:hypothetical protein [Actinomycetota bacterium]
MLALLVPLGLAAYSRASAATPAKAKNFQLIGHDPLYNRGMNAALAVFDDPLTHKTFVYVGNRTDGSPQHPHPGVLIVEATDPAHPTVVGEMGKPNEANVSETSRELRVWPQQRVLIIMNFQCDPIIHACTSPEGVGILTPTFRFYDLADPVHPSLLLTYTPGEDKNQVYTPHEMFLWADPAN